MQALTLTGLHHLTAITAQAPRNLAFYTHTLGMRLVKKSVNQDDVSAYHLFYADGIASPGSDLTFFDWEHLPQERRGRHSISRTALRVPAASMEWWAAHLAHNGIAHGGVTVRDWRPTLDFEDFEGQRLSLVADEPDAERHPWARSPIPEEHQVNGLGPVSLAIAQLAPTELVLTQALGMRLEREYPDPENPRYGVSVFSMGPGGPGAELHVAARPDLPVARQGAGGVHHVAFRVSTREEHSTWNQYLNNLGIATSGEVERYYFRSIYFREPNGILFELATDGPGFAVDEPLDQLGERLALPPFLEARREMIETGLKPLN